LRPSDQECRSTSISRFNKPLIILRNAYPWAQPSAAKVTRQERKDKTPRDVQPGFAPQFTAAVARSVLRGHAETAEYITKLGKRGLKDVTLREAASVIEVREGHFNPTLPLLPGQQGRMPDARLLPADWTNAVRAISEVRGKSPVLVELDAVRHRLRLTVEAPAATCRLWIPLLGHSGRMGTLIEKMKLTPTS
jgi:hypothetical protein